MYALMVLLIIMAHRTQPKEHDTFMAYARRKWGIK